MENKLLIAGFGGQGVMVIGQLLGYAACSAGKQATFLPTYGPEQRGGTANCTVVISDEEIGAPYTDSIDVLIAMNAPSLKKFLPKVKQGGVVLVNESMCDEKIDRDDVEGYYIPAVDIANEIGSQKVANIVMLGAYLNKSGSLTEEQMMDTVKVKLGKRPELLEYNRIAIRKGIEFTS
ncbi:2-oxoglutarate ferredoxin oxidoreductase subunit gamma [Dethiosulfatibacter aminovorans DSM 17477]|uniref:2-oxoglutarate ferredoxin oxidoreductase subunit gamma n=1 Tax=Dethiosulfatibacter aminovorans DSM 17477 TaxID=1121476 RepID=A0A1M6EIZ1_9FIRM|nr:2-oxoacid:acceptor oxidoreductase family protein [Dethiosulfatibacter aminovorans]SHI85386.1 2-oxoglutarate ferredoxin oxidoreductase subunit gamma [Dethiosulfatibacter aminovorans DSM 17477]